MEFKEFGDKRYELLRVSDVDRDGMWLELRDATYNEVLTIFYSDASGQMTFTAYEQDLSLDLVEWFIQKARQALPPLNQIDYPQS